MRFDRPTIWGGALVLSLMLASAFAYAHPVRSHLFPSSDDDLIVRVQASKKKPVDCRDKCAALCTSRRNPGQCESQCRARECK